MTVIQPIFYGGSGNGDIKLKSLTASASSLILAKNQSVDLQITPTMDLSNAELYEVSCDDSRVQLIQQPNHGLRVVTPNEKFPSTTQTVIHFRATDDSGVSLDVPLTLQTGLNPSEAREWFNSHTSPKQLTPSFEPLPGWKPFKDYASGAEIIARAIRDGKRYMVNIGDYFDETVDGNTYRWTIAEFNHYGQNEALMVPNMHIGTSGVQFADNSNTYSASNLESVFTRFYNSMPSSLKSYVLNMRLSWTNEYGNTIYLSEYVFPPSEIEAFGKTHYSKESSSYYSKWACFSDDSSRMRHYVNGSGGNWYWLRSTYNSYSWILPVVDYDGAYISQPSTAQGGALPCFCIG